MHVQGFLIPVFLKGEDDPFTLILISLLYWGTVLFIVFDIFRTIHRVRNKSIRSLTYNDFQAAIEGKIKNIITPMWIDAPLSEFIYDVGTLHRTMNKIMDKNPEYLEVLLLNPPDSKEYKSAVAAEYCIVDALTRAVVEICDKFGNAYKQQYAYLEDCPASVLQKYCTLVILLQKMKEKIENERFIPAEIKEKYLLIMKSLFSLIEIINSNIQISR